MTVPIVISSFGTTTHARETYACMDSAFQKKFANHDIRWAFSSRMVKEHSKKHSHSEIKGPEEVLQELYREGHRWAVVQSLHLINGHEFYRMVDEIGKLPIRASMGLPLLTSYHDYNRTAEALGLIGCTPAEDEAIVLVGHGTDHPAWSSYLAFESILRKISPRIFVGLIEGEPERSEVMDSVISSGARKIRIIPFTLVAGVHFKEDIAESEDSWQAEFEKAGMIVETEKRGIGYNRGIIDIFIDHIQEALDIIPESEKL